MKHLRVTLRPDPEYAPAFFNQLANSPDVAEARSIDWNRAAEETTTLLYAIDGDATRFAAAARDTAGIASVTLSATDETPTYALVEARERAIPMFDAIAKTVARAGLVVRKPLVYRDGRIHGHVVGEPAALQAALDEAPESFNVQIDEIGRFPSARANPATQLSERQHEALEVAMQLGYYDQPRAATHADIGEELGCAPNTASEHLQKAEGKLVRAGMNVFGPDV